MTLYFYNYNNYFNRKYKREENLVDYGDPLLVVPDVNTFNPRDGINTIHVINYNPAIENTPDYMLVTEDGDIVSRWFVMDAHYTRLNQYITVLYRDTLADNPEQFLDAPCFIEKATLGDSDPGIFNPEAMTFNQIKTRETLLKDATQSAWIVGYYAKNIAADKLSGTLPKNDVDTATRISVPIDQWEFYQYKDTPFKGSLRVNYYSLSVRKIINWGNTPEAIEARVVPFSASSAITRYNIENNTLGSNTVQVKNSDVSPTQVKDAFFATLAQRTTSTNLGNAVRTDVGTETAARTEQLLEFDGKEIVDSNGAHYRITISAVDTIEKTEILMDKTTYATTLNVLSNAVYPNGEWASPLSDYIYKTPMNTGTAGIPSNGCAFGLKYSYKKYTVKIVAIPSQDATYTISPMEALTSPYNMITIPYGDIVVKTANGDVQMSTEYSLRCAMALQHQMGSELYDIQLLPYCPLLEVADIDSDGKLDMTDHSELVNYIVQNNNKVGVILSVTNRDVTFDINYALNYSTEPAKVQALCDVYRLCSPNYSGQFEFNAIKNGGVNKFNVDMTLKPYTPYIHINPDFGGLYGSDFNDARGLICSGDFSIPQLTDKWVEYEINNKNYQNSFNREIQHMDVMRDIERTQQIAGVITGSIAGGTAGGKIGSSLGGAIGGAAGAAIGAGLSVAGGVVDYEMSEKAFKENRQWAQDRFGMALDNVKALPYSIGNVGAMNANNKVWPFIEYYTCSEVEKKALKDKIKYNGMTVGRIGTVREFLQSEPSYIKGQIIRLDGIQDDNHIAATIADEINKGVFI